MTLTRAEALRHQAAIRARRIKELEDATRPILPPITITDRMYGDPSIIIGDRDYSKTISDDGIGVVLGSLSGVHEVTVTFYTDDLTINPPEEDR